MLVKKLRQSSGDFARSAEDVKGESRARAFEEVCRGKECRKSCDEIGDAANGTRHCIGTSGRLHQEKWPWSPLREIVDDGAHIKFGPACAESNDRPEQTTALIDSVKACGNQPVISSGQWSGRGDSLRRRDMSGKLLHEVASKFFLKFVFEVLQVNSATINPKSRIIEGRWSYQDSLRASCRRTRGQEVRSLTLTEAHPASAAHNRRKQHLTSKILAVQQARQ